MPLIELSRKYAPMSFPMSYEEEQYLWGMSENQLLIDELEECLKVTCSVSFEERKMLLYDTLSSDIVAEITISDCPKKDLLKISYQWAMKIHIYRLEQKLKKEEF